MSIVYRCVSEKVAVRVAVNPFEQTPMADLISLRVTNRVLQGFARAYKSPYLSGLLFSGLLRVAPYCVPGGVRVVSGVHAEQRKHSQFIVMSVLTVTLGRKPLTYAFRW